MAKKAIYTLQDVPGKGKGLVATDNIPIGTRILCEEPVITVPELTTPPFERVQKSICQQVDTLSENQRERFLAMHNIHHYNNAAEQYLGIIRTNGLPYKSDRCGIFLDACRINHACDNNSQKHWNDKIKRHTVHALRDIQKGEEITIYYLAAEKPRKERQESLQEKFNFTCACGLCSLPPEQSRESDKRLEEIYQLDSLIGKLGGFGILSSPMKMLRYVDRQVKLYNEQGPNDNGLPRAFLDAAQILIANGDLARGRIFVERAVARRRLFEGDDSTLVCEHEALAKDPTKLELYGMSMRWKTALDEVPTGLGAEDFEDWLWRREKSQRPGQLTDLRNRSTFPAYSGLPDEHEIDLEFYQLSDNIVYRPRRHWCFLAEIVDCEVFVRLCLNIKDIDGQELLLSFYTEERGQELGRTKIQKGYTVAVLYGVRHFFLDGRIGIRHETPEMLKIFPVSLDGLMKLNDQVQQYSKKLDGLRKCHSCGKMAASLNRCAKCSLFWYCDRTCQIAGWNDKGHKAQCSLLKDPDLRSFFLLDWDKFHDFMQFPLQVKDC